MMMHDVEEIEITNDILKDGGHTTVCIDDDGSCAPPLPPMQSVPDGATTEDLDDSSDDNECTLPEYMITTGSKTTSRSKKAIILVALAALFAVMFMLGYTIGIKIPNGSSNSSTNAAALAAITNDGNYQTYENGGSKSSKSPKTSKAQSSKAHKSSKSCLQIGTEDNANCGRVGRPPCCQSKADCCQENTDGSVNKVNNDVICENEFLPGPDDTNPVCCVNEGGYCNDKSDCCGENVRQECVHNECTVETGLSVLTNGEDIGPFRNLQEEGPSRDEYEDEQTLLDGAVGDRRHIVRKQYNF